MDRQVTIESVKLVEQLKKIFPKDGYHLISLQEKFYVWEKNMDISKEKPIEQHDTGIRGRDLLNNTERSFFENLYGNIKPEMLINFNLKPKFIENNDELLTKTLILGEDFINNKRQRVLKFTFLNFRELDSDELKEKKLSEEEFINSLLNSFHPTQIEDDEDDGPGYYFFESEKIVIPGLIILIISILYMV
ncbi:MAG: hypothetical protein ACRC7F_07640 [Cetobacterium sp.]|uniref:hypothetical protein n=1 Tax=unclassified Cetobacterium TaxID=2630983 RepID=UPI0006460385|nr:MULTISPECIES: hypothetical protein [unclassified Cetobacterium]